MSLVLQSLLPYPNSCQGTSPHQQGWDTKMAMLSFHDGQSTQTRENLAQDFEAFGGEIGCQVRQAGDIAAWPCQGTDEPAADRVSRHREDDGNDRCGPLCRECWFGAICENQVDLAPDKLGREVGIALGASLAPAVLDRDGVTIDPAEFAQPLHTCIYPCALAYWPAAAEVPDSRRLAGLLRARRERPRCCRAADQRYECAPFHSIASSASPSSGSGTVSPSALAVLRLMTSVYLSACWIGRSPGFVPLRMRST